MEDRKFGDISHITKKQYKRYENWIDMVTVMGIVNSEVVKGLSGVLLVANMSNNKLIRHLTIQYLFIYLAFLD